MAPVNRIEATMMERDIQTKIANMGAKSPAAHAVKITGNMMIIMRSRRHLIHPPAR